MRKSNPFLFPSSLPSHDPSESMPPPSSPPQSVASSTSSKNSPYKPALNVLQSPVSNTHSTRVPPAATGPCPACEFHNRRCSQRCYVASFFPPDEVHKFAVVDGVFGSSNVVNFLQENSNSSYTPLLLLLRDTTREDLGTKNYTQSVTNFPKELGESVKSDHGRELVNQLKQYLSSASADTIREPLVQMILASFESFLSDFNSSEPIGSDGAAPIMSASKDHGKSTTFMDDDPGSVGSDAAKKRKTLAQTEDHIRVSGENGIEEPQYTRLQVALDIRVSGDNGIEEPQCICENTQKCEATKQMQISDEDPTMFDVESEGVHTCLQCRRSLQPPMLPEKQEKRDNISSNNQQQQLQGTSSNDQLIALIEPEISLQQLELNLSL